MDKSKTTKTINDNTIKLMSDNATFERTFKRSKETKNKVVFQEQNGSEPPVIESLYISKWWIGAAQEITVTVKGGAK